MENLKANDLYRSLEFARSIKGITNHNEELVFVQGIDQSDLLEKVSKKFSEMFDYVISWDLYWNDLSKETKEILEELGVPHDYHEIKLDKQDEVMEYILKNSELKPRFNSPRYMTHGYFDPEFIVGYFWPLEDIIDELSDDDMVRSWILIDEDIDGHSIISENDKNKKMLLRLLSNKK